MIKIPSLKPQEIALDDPESNNMFLPGPDKPFVATPAAIEMYTQEVIIACLILLRRKADEHRGLDYLQVFTFPEKPEDLWFMEDGPGGAITPQTIFHVAPSGAFNKRGWAGPVYHPDLVLVDLDSLDNRSDNLTSRLPIS